jgi:Tol biopolymer transport system component
MIRSIFILTAIATVFPNSHSVQPKLVGSGIISTDAAEFGASLNPTGHQLYFNRIDANGGMHIWRATGRNGSWRSAEKLAFSDDRYNDIDPFVSRTGDRLYFGSNRPRPGATDAAPRKDFDIWYSTLAHGQWSAPIFAGEAVNSDWNEVFASEDKSERLYYARRTGPDFVVMTSVRQGSHFAGAVQLDVPISAVGHMSNPAISPDGTTLIMTGGDVAAPRLWVSHRSRTGAWSSFEPLGLGLTQAGTKTFAPYISNDGRTLYFTGERPIAGSERGQRDIYVAPLAR